MRHISFAYNPFLHEAKILVDQEPLSRLSMLKPFLTLPFDQYCISLAETINLDLRDRFDLDFRSMPFESFVMRALMQNNPDDSFSSQPFAYSASIAERFDALQDAGFRERVMSRVRVCVSGDKGAALFAGLCKRNDFKYDADTRTIQYTRYAAYNPVSLCINEDPSVDVDLVIGVFFDLQEAALFYNTVQNDTPSVTVAIGDMTNATAKPNKYLLAMCEEDFIGLLPDILDSLVVASTVSAAARSENLHFVSDAERELITAVEPVVRITCCDMLPCQHSYTPDIHVFPRGSAVPEITAVVRCYGSSIEGVSPGTAKIEFFVKGYYRPVLRQTVRVFREVRIERITLSSDSVYAKPGQEVDLDFAAYPQVSSEMLEELVWRSDNPSVATVDSCGVVRMIAPGNCVISLSNSEVSAHCRVEVAPAAERIDLQFDNTIHPLGNSISSIIGQSIPVRVVVMPENAYDTTIRHEIRQDNSMYPVLELADGMIVTKGIGRAVITFISDDTGVQTSMEVNVVDTQNLSTRNPCLVFSALLQIAALILSFIEPGIGLICALVAVGLSCIGVRASQKIRLRLSLIIGYIIEYKLTSSYAAVVISIILTILNIVRLCI